jgi:thiamine-monophosphate kinase
MTSSDHTHTHLGSGSEFDIIRDLLVEWGDVAEGIGDDAAILDVPVGQQLIVSTDATVEDVHFRRKWMSAHDVGARAATAALSDLAAMGATAHAVLVSLVVPTVWREHVRDFAGGLKVSVHAAGARIVGGNISRGAAFSCTLTVVGYAAKPVRRSGARVGDDLYVTGVLGGPGAAVAAWERNATPEPWALQRFLHPSARIQEGQWLAQSGASAMIDISDGIAADARHLSAASGTHCVVSADLVPTFAAVSPADALQSGEEYELLVALPHDGAFELATAFEARFGIPLTQVGWVEAIGDAPLTANAGDIVELHPGHDHFSG